MSSFFEQLFGESPTADERRAAVGWLCAGVQSVRVGAGSREGVRGPKKLSGDNVSVVVVKVSNW